METFVVFWKSDYLKILSIAKEFHNFEQFFVSVPKISQGCLFALRCSLYIEAKAIRYGYDTSVDIFSDI